MKQFLLIIMIACYAFTGTAQNIGINATGTSPDSQRNAGCAKHSKGFLMPRMTTAQRTAITTPAEGLKSI